MDRVKVLEQIVDTYVDLLEKKKLPDEVRAHFDAGRAAALTELRGERGAKGLNPDTGEK